MTFETRLLDELQQIVALQPKPAARAPRRRLVPALATAVAGVAIALAILVVGGGGGPTPAYAVDKAANGMVTVQIKSLRDSAGLEQKLADVGVKAKVDYLEPGTTCRAGRFKPARGVGKLHDRPAHQRGRHRQLQRRSAQARRRPDARRHGLGVRRHDDVGTAVADGAVGPCMPVKSVGTGPNAVPNGTGPSTAPAPGNAHGAGPDKGLEQRGG